MLRPAPGRIATSPGALLGRWLDAPASADQRDASASTLTGGDSNTQTGRLDIEQVYDEHANDVARWVRRFGGPDADVADCVHDVFAITMAKRPSVDGEASLKTWLFRVTHNVMRRRMRRERLRSWVRQALPWNLGGEETTTPEVHAVDARLSVADLYRALDRLPEAQRTLLVSFEIERVPGSVLASAMGCTVQTLWVRLHRARKALLIELKRLDRKETW